MNNVSLLTFLFLFSSCTSSFNHRDIASSKLKEINWEQRDYPDSCFSGEELGVSIRTRTKISNDALGGGLSTQEMKIDDGRYYGKLINGERIEVTDNIFEKELEKKYPFLVDGQKRVVGIKVQENLPVIEGLTYQQDEFDEYLAPNRTWKFNFYAHDGNQSLIITDNPLKIIKNSRGSYIEHQEVDSPKYMRSFEFFPRKYVTQYEILPDRKNAQEMIVTLTTGEKVRFDAKTGKVIGGVFKSISRAKSKSTQKYKAFDRFYHQNEFQYTGAGVWIEVDESEKRGFSRRSLTKQNTKMKVKIRKNPGLECEVNSEDLWGVNLVDGAKTSESYRSTKEEYIEFKKAQGINNPSPYGHLNTAYTCYKFKFKTDEEFNKFLMSKCGFGFL